jgi:hypothetical protein
MQAALYSFKIKSLVEVFEENIFYSVDFSSFVCGIAEVHDSSHYHHTDQ